MKLLNLPIQVDAPSGRPERIRWKDRILPVRQTVDFWVLQSRWWSKHERRVYFLVDTPRGQAEIYRSGERWILARIFD